MDRVVAPFSLGTRSIGPGFPCFIMAEAGVNHNGDLDRALELVRQAKMAGADCVKFQTFKAEELVTATAPKADYQLKVTDPQESQLAMLKKLELPKKDFETIKKACEKEGILFLSTPYCFSDIDLLNEIGVAGFKVASGQLTEPPFLAYMAGKKKPMILSTGMGSLNDIQEALDTIRKAGHPPVAVLQCTTNYPSSLSDTNLRAMPAMAGALQVPIGYSDHTIGQTAILGAVALGACIIEKHFTLDKHLPGPDHACSMEPADFKAMVAAVRDMEKTLGSDRKEPSAAEIQNAKGMKRSIVTAQRIPKGTRITAAMLTFKRPATGMAPREFDRIVGQLAACDIPADTLLTSAMVEPVKANV